MWIILEGTDYAGKTTIANKMYDLCRRIFTSRDVQMMHRSRPDPETRRAVLNDYVLSVESYRPGAEQVLICDRWHFGEATYAPIKRPHTNRDGYGLLGQSGWRWTELFLLSRGAITVWVNQPLDMLIRRSGRGDDYIRVDELAEISKLYAGAMTQSPTMRLELTPPDGDDMTQVIDIVISTALQVGYEVEKLLPFPEYVGGPTPAALLVGDRRNLTKKYGHETNLAFMPVDGNSAEFLLSALPDPLWRDIGMINANDITVDLNTLVETLGNPPIVALGQNAADGLRKAGVDRFMTMPHPQHVRRFRNSEHLVYGDAIGDAISTGRVDPTWQLS